MGNLRSRSCGLISKPPASLQLRVWSRETCSSPEVKGRGGWGNKRRKKGKFLLSTSLWLQPHYLLVCNPATCGSWRIKLLQHYCLLKQKPCFCFSDKAVQSIKPNKPVHLEGITSLFMFLVTNISPSLHLAIFSCHIFLATSIGPSSIPFPHCSLIISTALSNSR